MLTSAKGKSWPFGVQFVFHREAIQLFYNVRCVSLITTVGLSLVWLRIPKGKVAADTNNARKQKGQGEILAKSSTLERKIWFCSDGWRCGGEWESRKGKQEANIFWRKQDLREKSVHFDLKMTETEKDASWGRVEEAAVITESLHVHNDVPQTPIKEFVDRMH